MLECDINDLMMISRMMISSYQMTHNLYLKEIRIHKIDPFFVSTKAQNFDVLFYILKMTNYKQYTIKYADIASSSDIDQLQ